MDPILASRLNTDEEFTKKVTKLVREYIELGRSSLDYWSGDFDIAFDVMMCYAPMTKQDYESLADGHPKRFVLPLTATQITTMGTYISQVLFGQEAPHKVNPRGPEDEIPAEYMNQLLRWNAEQQPTYLLGHLWTQNALVANRGIFYNYWAPLYGHQVVNTPALDPVTNQQYFRPTRKKVLVGGYCRFDPVSPYDWICDPMLPLWRFQEGRFSGHRTVLPFTELVRRSKLPAEDPCFVLPAAIDALKEKKKAAQNSLTTPLAGPPSTSTNNTISATQYERGRTSNPNGQQTANKEDLGNIECFELWVKLIPADYPEIFPEGSDEPVIFQVLVAGSDVVCCLNESTYAHGEFPYSVGEGRPNGLSQFAPSWVMMLKGLQDYVDWLKNRHQEALSRTVGNIFIYDPASVDVDDFLNPEKEGIMIPLKETAGGKKISDVIQQVPVHDLTENFHDEMVEFARMSENVTGANTYMQGNTAGEASATEFAGVQQMGAGRMASIARLLSTQGIVPQTRQIVSNFQQFLEISQAVRFTPSENTPEALLGVASLVLTRDVIQGSFDFISHDGTLPGTDGKKVAAIARLLESAAAFPDVFAPAPGNLNPRRLIFAAAKAAGVNIENFKYRPQDIPSITPPPGAPSPVGGAPGGPGGPPGPSPAQLTPPEAPGLSMASAAPPQTRPGNL
jgi:hypothetical protein